MPTGRLTGYQTSDSWGFYKPHTMQEGQKNRWIFVCERCKFWNKPYPPFYFHRQLYKVKGKFSIEVYLPWIHFYFEYKVGQYLDEYNNTNKTQ